MEKTSNLSQEKSKIIWPQLGSIEVGPDVDFVYIMRKDGEFTMKKLGNLPEILRYYDIFFANLTDHLQIAFKDKGNFELHLFDPKELDSAIMGRSDETPIISLDPMLINNAYPFAVSRGYFLSGQVDYGQISRPGSLPLDIQAKQVADLFNGQLINVAEDDIFSGGSIIASINNLRSQGVNIGKVVPGIQVGESDSLKNICLDIDPVVKYQFGNIDLGDPRDFLLGASGLVVKLPSGQLGRAPYILPFVSPAARTSMAVNSEREFSENVLLSNRKFFVNSSLYLGHQIELQDMDRNFMVMINELYGFSSRTYMVDVVDWSLGNLDQIWKYNQELGANNV